MHSFSRYQPFHDFLSGKFPLQDFFLEIGNPPSVIPNGLPLILMAESARWRDEVNPVAIGQDGPTLPARWSRKKFSFLPYNIYLIDFMLYRIMPEL